MAVAQAVKVVAGAIKFAPGNKERVVYQRVGRQAGVELWLFGSGWGQCRGCAGVVGSPSHGPAHTAAPNGLPPWCFPGFWASRRSEPPKNRENAKVFQGPLATL